MSSEEPFRIAVFVSNSTNYGPRILQGLADYAHTHPSYNFFLGQLDPFWIEGGIRAWQPHGIIAQLSNNALAAAVSTAGIPVVSVSNQQAFAGIPQCILNIPAIAGEAADHFAARGYHHVGYFGDQSRTSNSYLAQTIARIAAERQFDFHLHQSPRVKWSMGRQLSHVAKWLITRPKPFALLTFDDEHGDRALHAASHAGLRVPEDVAVLAINNDHIFCEFCSPPLSSIDINQPGIGYRAAELMAELLAGKPPPAEPILVPPGGVVVRRSTDHFAVLDEVVREALALIVAKLEEYITPDELAERLAISKSTLERRFKAALGRSPWQEIRRHQLELATRLVRETKLPLIEVTHRCGYKHTSQLSRDIRLATGETPRQYRLAHAGH